MSTRLTQQTFLEQDPHTRRDDDFYVTPAWMTRALLTRRPIDEHIPGLVFEPCAGNGAIIKVLDPSTALITNDVTARGGLVPDFLSDATRPESWTAFRRLGSIGVVLTNPPFKLALPILQLAYEHATCGVAFLLRITWLEPTLEREAWLKAYPPTRIIVMRRWKFRGSGSGDTATCAWMLWAKQRWFCEPGIEVVTEAERKQLIGEEKRARHAHGLGRRGVS